MKTIKVGLEFHLVLFIETYFVMCSLFENYLIFFSLLKNGFKDIPGWLVPIHYKCIALVKCIDNLFARFT